MPPLPKQTARRRNVKSIYDLEEFKEEKDKEINVKEETAEGETDKDQPKSSQHQLSEIPSDENLSILTFQFSLSGMIDSSSEDILYLPYIQN